VYKLTGSFPVLAQIAGVAGTNECGDMSVATSLSKKGAAGRLQESDSPVLVAADTSSPVEVRSVLNRIQYRLRSIRASSFRSIEHLLGCTEVLRRFHGQERSDEHFRVYVVSG
jgi:hypothetical protein